MNRAKLNSHVHELIISSDLDNLKKVEKFCQKICHTVGFSDEQCDNMAIALTELAINAIMHGNKEDKRKKVTIHSVFKDDRIEVSISDEGGGFDPDKLPNPTNPQNIWKEHGRGIFLVQNLIDEVIFQKTGEGMKIILTEYLPKKKSSNL
jgi:anti-sigma regulatory factor (Ser/Thr protein kinase)